jgi:uncharacterized protein YdeI (YjbR/CyaY-like superfamily)
MPQKHIFTTPIQNTGGDGAYVELPAELKKAFKTEKEAKTFFEKLAYSHQREYVGYITEAKKAETRERRVAQTIERLKNGNRGI